MIEAAKHTATVYDDELTSLKNGLILMGDEVRSMLRQSIAALKGRDRDRAFATMALDHTVNRLEMESDNLCLCVNICQRKAELDAAPDPDIGPRFEEMGTRVGAMIEGARSASRASESQAACRTTIV